ncbi:MAG: hypothetical protein ACLQVD_09610 [Capsulimonadaceae bacterium]
MPQLTPVNAVGAGLASRPATWQVTSAFPGRIRLQAGNSAGNGSALQACATRIAAISAVTEVSIIPQARSLVVRYEASAQRLPDMVNEVLTAAGPAPARSASPRFSQRERNELDVALLPPKMEGEENGQTLIPPVSGMGSDEAGADRPPCDNDMTLGCVVGRAVARAPGATMHIRAKDLPFHPPPVAPIIWPTIAMAAAAIEVVPAALTLAALAVASVPIARRTAVSIQKRQFTSDSMDLANVVLLVFEGSVLQAGAITWLVQVATMIRHDTMHKAHRRVHASVAIAGRDGNEHRKQKTLDTLERALLGDSQHQHVWTKAKNSLSTPLAVAALIAFAITRDPGYLIGLMRPRADFNAALCFGVPAPILTAMTRAAAHGPLLRNTAAVERLAQIDAIVYATIGSNKDEHLLGRRVRSLMKRGIRRFILPTDHEVQIVRRTAARAGIDGVIVEPMPEDRHSIIRKLVRHGHHVLLIDDGQHSPIDIAHADIHLVIDTGQQIAESAHIIMSHSDLHGLVQAIDISREAVHSIRHNTALAASAAGINLVLSLVPPVAATAVNTATTAIMASRSLRSERVDGTPERPPHLPHPRVTRKHPAAPGGEDHGTTN